MHQPGDLARALRTIHPDFAVVPPPYDQWGTSPCFLWTSADPRAVGRAELDAIDDAGNRGIHTAPDDGAPRDGIGRIALLYSRTPIQVVDVTGCEEVAIASLARHAWYLAAIAPGEDKFASRTIAAALSTYADSFNDRSFVASEVLADRPD